MKPSLTATPLLLVLCAPALLALSSAAAQPALETYRLEFTHQGGSKPRTFEVAIVLGGPCATAHQRVSDLEIDLRACATSERRLELEWRTKTSTGEYSLASSMQLQHGLRTALGPADGPRFLVAVQ